MIALIRRGDLPAQRATLERGVDDILTVPFSGLSALTPDSVAFVHFAPGHSAALDHAETALRTHAQRGGHLCWPFGSSEPVMSVRGSPARRPALR